MITTNFNKYIKVSSNSDTSTNQDTILEDWINSITNSPGLAAWLRTNLSKINWHVPIDEVIGFGSVTEDKDIFESFSYLDGTHDLSWSSFKFLKHNHMNPLRIAARRIVGKRWYQDNYENFLSYNYQRIRILADLYKENTSISKIVITNVKENKSIVAPSKNRFSKAYRRDLQIKLQDLPDLMKDARGKYFVFTADVKKFNNYQDLRDTTSKCINNIITLIKRIAKRRDTYCEFLRTYETTEAGMLHVNLVIFGIDWFYDGERCYNCIKTKRDKRCSECKPFELSHIIKLWNPASTASNAVEYKRVRAGEDKERLRAYVCKYIFKQFKIYERQGRKVTEINQDTVIGWAFGWRAYSISKNLAYACYGFRSSPEYDAVQAQIFNATGLGLRPITNKNSVWRYCCTIKDTQEGLFAYSEVPHRHLQLWDIDPGG